MNDIQAPWVGCSKEEYDFRLYDALADFEDEDEDDELEEYETDDTEDRERQDNPDRG